MFLSFRHVEYRDGRLGCNECFPYFFRGLNSRVLTMSCGLNGRLTSGRCSLTSVGTVLKRKTGYLSENLFDSSSCLCYFSPTLSVAENNAKNRICNPLIISIHFGRGQKIGSKSPKIGLQLMNIHLANVH